MPRQARFVVPGAPHHVTQRGNHRARVFFSPHDQAAYLHLLRDRAARHAIEIVAYCLMPNHVHLVVVPESADALHRAMGVVHSQYARRINRMKDRTGHCWQSRFFSSPLSERYFLNAVRYVEQNPVRARMVARAEDYQGSSAAAHCGLQGDPLVEVKPRSPLLAAIVSWSRWLAEGIADDELETLRKNGSQNLPCGDDEFVSRLEASAGRSLRFRPPGRMSDSE